MTTASSAFAALAEPTEQEAQWLRRKLEARRRIAVLGEQALFQSLAGTLTVAYEQGQPLPDHEELRELVENLLGSPSHDDQGAVAKPTDQDVAVVASGAVATFLCNSQPGIERLTAVAKVEFYLDLELVAELVSKSDAATSWLSVLEKLTFNLESINDDEYAASDELERWQKEVPRSVPSWQEGNFPSLSGSVELLVSSLLRALDVGAWLKFLDGLPIPALVESLLWHTTVKRAPESVLDWIRRAPLAFDQSGSRTTSTLVFLLERKATNLLEGALDRRARGAEEDLVGPTTKATDEALGELARSINERADGKVLLVELAARSLVRAQSRHPESIGARLRRDLQHAMGIAYSSALGTLPELLRLSRARAALDASRSVLGLWLLAPTRGEHELTANTDEVTGIFRDSWPWLLEILCASDAGIAERYSQTAQWTERLAGLALAARAEPLRELELAWQALTQQRLKPVETRYERDPWSTTRFLIRAGFFAARLETHPATGQDLWNAAMGMALSAWFAQTNQEPFAEVRYGLAHLAAGKLEIAGEPARTLSYLIGETDEFAEATFGLLENGFDATGVVHSASVAGIDAIAYLQLIRKSAKKAAVDGAIAALSKTAKSDPASEGLPAVHSNKDS